MLEMKEKKVETVRKRTFLLISLMLFLLVDVIMVGILVQSTPGTVRVYAGIHIIPGKPVGTYFDIDIYVDSPPEWENTSQGIVGWALNVEVNPAVLEPTTVRGAMAGYFLYDFIAKYGYYGHEPKLLYTLNKTAGLFSDVSEFIFGWNVTGVGAGGSGKLCTLRVKSLSQTAYSQIDIFDACYYIVAPTLEEGKRPVDIVQDGHYNTPPHDVAITSVTRSPTEIYIRQPINININVTVKNEGLNTETFNVTVYRNDTAIGTQKVTNLAPGTNATLTFVWNITGLPIGAYIIKAEASVVLNETDTTDNTLIDGAVKIKIADASGDGRVNIYDLAMLGKAYGTKDGEPHFDPRVDFNGDGKVGYEDLFLLALTWGYSE